MDGKLRREKKANVKKVGLIQIILSVPLRKHVHLNLIVFNKRLLGYYLYVDQSFELYKLHK